MLECFTDKAIKVITLAQDESRRLGRDSVGTEQLLLGIIREQSGVAAKVLSTIGITLNAARAEVEKNTDRSSHAAQMPVPFEPNAQQVLKLSLEETRKFCRHYVGTEHLLLGLLRDREGLAAKILRNLGVDPVDVQVRLLGILQN
jgi:ATP-dependent Clp protease ATP-binding subunit ClpC